MGEGDVTKVICKARSVIYLKGFLRFKKKKAFEKEVLSKILQKSPFKKGIPNQD